VRVLAAPQTRKSEFSWVAPPKPRRGGKAARLESEPCATSILVCLPKQVRTTLAFRQRQFVASNSGIFLLTCLVHDDIITMCYCGVQSCARASLPPSRSRARPSYEVRRAKFRRQNPRDENPGLGLGQWARAVGRELTAESSRPPTVGCRLSASKGWKISVGGGFGIADCRLSICEVLDLGLRT